MHAHGLDNFLSRFTKEQSYTIWHPTWMRSGGEAKSRGGGEEKVGGKGWEGRRRSRVKEIRASRRPGTYVDPYT